MQSIAIENSVFSILPGVATVDFLQLHLISLWMQLNSSLMIKEWGKSFKNHKTKI